MAPVFISDALIQQRDAGEYMQNSMSIAGLRVTPGKWLCVLIAAIILAGVSGVRKIPSMDLYWINYVPNKPVLNNTLSTA
jgi:hypothetical protein